jgi:hypothetical protein
VALRPTETLYTPTATMGQILECAFFVFNAAGIPAGRILSVLCVLGGSNSPRRQEVTRYPSAYALARAQASHKNGTGKWEPLSAAAIVDDEPSPLGERLPHFHLWWCCQGASSAHLIGQLVLLAGCFINLLDHQGARAAASE